MKRTVDKPYFTYSAYTSKSTGIDVKCSKCAGLGVVTTDRDSAYFKCTNCGDFKNKELAIYRYNVRCYCKTCGKYHNIVIVDKAKQHFKMLNISCTDCGATMVGEVHKTLEDFSYRYEIKNGIEPYFGFKLWYLTSFNTQFIWAINRAHLAYLIDYLSADLREKHQGHRVQKTQSDHLPTFMKTAKNRTKIVSVLKKTQMI